MKKLILSATIFLILILSLFYYKGAYIGELQDSQQVLGGKYLIKKYTTKSLLQYLPSMGTSSDKVNGYVRVFDSKEESIIFEKYVKRFPPLYPAMTGKGNMILNIEELATIFHFPIQTNILSSGVPRIMSRRATPPGNLPMG